MANYTISDIARICGVSKATVSRVINNKPQGVSDKTRQKVRKTMEKLNYRPSMLARSVATSHSHLVGLVIPDISSLFYPDIISAVNKYFSSHGYSIVLANTDYSAEKERVQLLSMVDKRVDGVILCSGTSNEEFLAEYRKYGIPLASIGRMYDNYLCDISISGDNVKGAKLAVKHLLSTGNEKIALLSGNKDVAGTLQRIEGYRQALEEAGLPFDRSLIYNGEYTISSGIEMTMQILEDKKDFTAVLAGSDLIAIGVLKALRQKNIAVPNQIEVMGFDNISLAEIFEPQLSTISKPHQHMAAEISRKLYRLINGKENDIAHFIVEPELVIRYTTKS